MKSQCFAVIHIAKSLEKADPQAKTCQRVCLPQHTDRLKQGSTGYNTQYKKLGG